MVFEYGVGDRGDQLLHLLQVFGPADDGACPGVLEYEVAEGELPGDVVAHLREEGLRVLGDEAGAQRLGRFAVFGLGGLQQHGHERIVLFDPPAEFDAGVGLLVGGAVAPVADDPHVGDHPQQIVPVLFVEPEGFVVAGGEQDLRAGPLAQHLLLFVEGVLQKPGVLEQEQLVELGQVGRVEADRILDQQNGLHAPFENVLVGVHLVLHEFDDGRDELRVAVPAEYGVEPRAVLLLDAAVDVLREAGQQRHGNLGPPFADDPPEPEHVGFAHVVHGQDEVEPGLPLQPFERLAGRAYPREGGRVRHVQIEVLPVDLLLDVSVLLEDVAVVAAADEQDLVYAALHQGAFGPGLGSEISVHGGK